MKKKPDKSLGTAVTTPERPEIEEDRAEKDGEQELVDLSEFGLSDTGAPPLESDRALPVVLTAQTGSAEELERFDRIMLANQQAFGRAALVGRSRAAARAPRRPPRSAALLAALADEVLSQDPALENWRLEKRLVKAVNEYNCSHPKEKPLAAAESTLKRHIALARKRKLII